MKRTLFFMLLSAGLSAPAAWADNFVADGIYYNITSYSDKTVEVTKGSYWGDVIIPETITNEGIEYRVIAIGNRAFYECVVLTSVTIPESVQVIGEAAFYYCRCLTSVTIPESVQVIGDGAFYECGRLTSVTIPNSVTSIGELAFYGCTDLTEFKGKFAVDNCCLIVNDTLKAFAPNSGLSEYTIPDEVKVISNGAFAYCDGLTSVTIPNSVTAIGNEAFSVCRGLTEFKGKFATADHRCLVINDTLKAFAPSGLTQYTIPDGVKVIGYEAFEDCQNLTSVTIPNSVTVIGDCAFYDCENLTSITIPESVTSIGDGAFYGCMGLTTVTAYNPTPVDISTFVFYRVDCANCKLYVPKGSVEAYRNAEGWSEFGEILPIDESSAITETRQDNADGHVTVYNLQGVPVLETDDAADLKMLQNGAYIVNGKTMIIAR